MAKTGLTLRSKVIRLLDKSLDSHPKQDVNHLCPDTAIDPTGFVVEEGRQFYMAILVGHRRELACLFLVVICSTPASTLWDLWSMRAVNVKAIYLSRQIYRQIYRVNLIQNIYNYYLRWSIDGND